MVYKYQFLKFWICDCDCVIGGYIIDGFYSICVYCGKYWYELKEIVVLLGLGGVFCVEIFSVEDDCVKVKVVKSLNGFDVLLFFIVLFKDIMLCWKYKVGEI